MSETIEVTQSMVEAGIEALNELRTSEVALRKRETVEMSWADLLSAAYAGMERRRRLDDHLATIMHDLQVGGHA